QKLPDDVIADLEKWVVMGAPDPRDGGAAPPNVAIDIDKGRKFWSFQPPRKPTVPQVKDRTWARSDVDRFLHAAMEPKGVKPVGDADPQALVRRLYFDLIGLPPTPEQNDAFVKSYRGSGGAQAAVEKLVDELLASKHFGELWGRHWLDVARYAESSGRQVNFTYPHAW